jgi:hypothetical protein
MNTYMPTVTHAFKPTATTSCWSVYVGAKLRDSQYTDGHGYGATRDEAVAAAHRDLRRKCEGEVALAGSVKDDGRIS